MLRKRNYSLEDVTLMLREFGVDFRARWHNVQNPQKAQVVFSEAIQDAKKEYKRLALVHHPDRGGDAEEFKRISTLWGILEKLNPIPEQPRPVVMPMSIVVHYYGGTGSTSTTYTNTSTSSATGW